MSKAKGTYEKATGTLQRGLGPMLSSMWTTHLIYARDQASASVLLEGDLFCFQGNRSASMTLGVHEGKGIRSASKDRG